jgi:hypothetical protein
VSPSLRTALMLLSLAPAPTWGADAAGYADMAESMVTMMDAFADAYGKRRPGGLSPGTMPMSPTPCGSNPLGAMGMASLPWGSMPFDTPAWPELPSMGSETPPWNAFGGGLPGGLPSLFPHLPAPTPAAAPSSPLEGIWLGQSGEVLVIRDGRFRIYQDPDNYREGRLQLQGDRLAMQDPESGNALEYDFIHEEDHLALRDPWGGVLLYRLLLRQSP